MFCWLFPRWAARHLAQLNRFTALARHADELIAYGNLSPATRQQLQSRREQLRQLAVALAYR